MFKSARLANEQDPNERTKG